MGGKSDVNSTVSSSLLAGRSVLHPSQPSASEWARVPFNGGMQRGGTWKMLLERRFALSPCGVRQDGPPLRGMGDDLGQEGSNSLVVEEGPTFLH